jgi:hypothetical protein
MRISGFLAASVLAFSLTAETPGHSEWNEILQKYVTDESRVDYRSLQEHGAAQLDRYLQQLAAPWPKGMTVQEQKAALINAYNALTLRWIISNYPVESIWRTSHPFTEARHMLDGQKTSLDLIELRVSSLGDPKIHAALVGAARSCPPLRREAYESATVDAQLDANLRAWLANPSLNEFVPERRMAAVSSIFKYHKGEFQNSGLSVAETLARFAPAGKAQFLREPGAQIVYKTYDWGLNDASGLGSGYLKVEFIWDKVRNRVF